MILLIALACLLLYILYLLKINYDLLLYKDKTLRALAALDAIIIKKNLAVLDILGYAQEFMDKEHVLISDLFNIRHDINKIRTKIANANERYEKQREFDSKIDVLLSAVPRYPDLKKNIGFQKSLVSFYNIEKEFNIRVEEYNFIVERLSNLTQNFPGNIIAKLTHAMKPPAPYKK